MKVTTKGIISLENSVITKIRPSKLHFIIELSHYEDDIHTLLCCLAKFFFYSINQRGLNTKVSSSSGVPRNLSNRMVRAVLTGDTVLVKSREITGRGQDPNTAAVTGGEGVKKTTESKIHLSRWHKP